jgi:predicted histone-like DNA-binding protein
MAEYEMQEMNIPNAEGKKVLYPRIVQHGRTDSKELANMMAVGTSFGAAEISGMLEMLAEHLAKQLANGQSVKIDGIGTFTAALSLAKDKERETGDEGSRRRNAQSIAVGGINFRADKQLVTKTNGFCTLERSTRKFQRSSDKYTAEERLQMALQYLSEHPFMRVRDYATLAGLVHSTAAKELKEWAKDENIGIKTIGRATHKVYIATGRQP